MPETLLDLMLTKNDATAIRYRDLRQISDCANSLHLKYASVHICVLKIILESC